MGNSDIELQLDMGQLPQPPEFVHCRFYGAQVNCVSSTVVYVKGEDNNNNIAAGHYYKCMFSNHAVSAPQYQASWFIMHHITHTL
jgi:hypothetical protein